MNREELKAYLAAQLTEVRRYWEDLKRAGNAPETFGECVQQWVLLHAEEYQRDWMRDRRPSR